MANALKVLISSKFLLNCAINTRLSTEDRNTFNLERLIMTYHAVSEYKYIKFQIGLAPDLLFRRWPVLFKGALGSHWCLSLKQ